MMKSLHRFGTIAFAIAVAILVAAGVASAQHPIRITPADSLHFNVGETKTIQVENLTSMVVKVGIYARVDGSFQMKTEQVVELTGHPYTFDVTYAGQQGGASGVIVFEYSGMSQYIKLVGEAAEAPALDVKEFIDFGAVRKDEKNCQELTFTNHAADPIDLTYAMIGHSSQFVLDPKMGTLTLKSGETGNIQICYAPDGSEQYSKEQLVLAYSGGATGTAFVTLAGSLHHDPDSNQPCLYVSHATDLGHVLSGHSAEGYIYLANNQAIPVTISKVSLYGPDAERFEILTETPITVEAYSRGELKVRFTPDQGTTPRKYYTDVLIFMQAGGRECNTLSTTLYASSAETTSEHHRHSIFGTKELLGIDYTRQPLQKILFYNDLDHEVEVKFVRFLSGEKFNIVETHPATPAKLAAGEEIVVVVQYTGGVDGYFTDAIVFETDQGTIESFDFHGAKAAQAAVTPEVTPRISLSPNPATDQIAVDCGDARSATIEVYNLLGQQLATTQATQWTWLRGGAPAGTYLIRIDGVSASGAHFVHTERVVLR